MFCWHLFGHEGCHLILLFGIEKACIWQRAAVPGLHEWLKVNNWFTIFATDLVGNQTKWELPNCFSFSKCSGFSMINIFTQIFISDDLFFCLGSVVLNHHLSFQPYLSQGKFQTLFPLIRKQAGVGVEIPWLFLIYKDLHITEKTQQLEYVIKQILSAG